jgi:hypothetical protein
LPLQESDRVKEQIRFNTEVIKLIFALFVAAFGSIVALLIDRVSSGREVVFTAGGMIVAVACIVLFFKIYSNTKNLIHNG